MADDTPDHRGDGRRKPGSGASMQSSKISRRGVLAAIAGGAGLAAVASSQAPTDPDSLGVGGDPGVLAIGPAETYRMPDSGAETYRAANVADGGTLELQDGGAALELTDQA